MGRLIEIISKNPALEFIDSETEKSYSLTDLLHTGFHDKLNRPRSLAFLYLDNSLSSLSTLLNFFNSSHVLVLLNPKLHLSLKQKLEELYNPGIIYDAERDSIDTYSTIDWVFNRKLFVNSASVLELHPNLKLLLSTSGTTGSPKFVKLSEDNIIENAQSIVDYLPIKNSDVTPLNLPIYYSYGLSVLTSNSIAGGKIICSNKDVLQKEFWQEMDKFGYTSLSGVPYFYEMLNRLGFTKKQYPALRYLTQAGGKLNEKMIDIFSEYSTQNDIEFYIMYGQTEATARMSYLPPSLLKTKKGSIGKPIKNGKFGIVKETGELVYEGPNVFAGYTEKPGDLASFEKQNKLHTGDIAEMDETGFYYIKGRLKRFAKIFGNRINLDEVEQLLKNNFQGTQLSCTSINDQFLLIFFTENNNVDENLVKQFIFDNLKIHPTVIKTLQLAEIPLTDNGKPDYRKLIGLFEANK